MPPNIYIIIYYDLQPEVGMRLLYLFFYRLCYSPMLHIMSDYAPPYSDYAPACSNYALQYSSKLDMVQKLSVLFLEAQFLQACMLYRRFYL